MCIVVPKLSPPLARGRAQVMSCGIDHLEPYGALGLALAAASVSRPRIVTRCPRSEARFIDSMTESAASSGTSTIENRSAI